MRAVLIEQAAIRRLIPHAGAMCLLDAVIAWDESAIACRSMSHRDPANPLRRQGRLAGLHVFEYGAQAAAIHGALLAQSAGGRAPPAYLAALRDARLRRAWLDDITTPLDVDARRLLGAGSDCVYRIETRAAGVVVAEARVTIITRPGIEPC